MSNSSDSDPGWQAILGGLATLAIGLVAVILVVSLLYSLAAGGIVDQGERGVYTRMGQVQGTVGPGFHPMIVGVDNIRTYEVRSQAYTMSSKVGEGDNLNRDDAINALTQEGLNIEIDMTGRYRIQANEVGSIYTNVAPTQELLTKRIVRPTYREAVRSCSAQYAVEEIYAGKRDDFSQCVETKVSNQFSENGLTSEAVQIRNIMLPTEVRKAIQRKQAAQEKIETKKKQLKIEKLEKQRRIIEAEGISESQKIIDESLTQQYLQYLFITEGLEKGDTIYVPMGEGGMELYKDVDKTNPGGNSTSTNNSTSTTDSSTIPSAP